MIRPYVIYNVLKEISGKKTVEERVELLQKYDTPTLRLVLQHMYSDDIKYDLPQGTPPCKDNEFQPEPGYFWKSLRTINYFITPNNIKKTKKEQMFIDLLETAPREDRVILVAMKDKIVPKEIKRVNPRVINVAFPGLLSIVGEDDGE